MAHFRNILLLISAIYLAGSICAPLAHAKDGGGGSDHGESGGHGGGDDGGSHTGGGSSGSGDDSGSHGEDSDSGGDSSSGRGDDGTGSSRSSGGRGASGTRGGDDDASSTKDRSGEPTLSAGRRKEAWGKSTPEVARAAVTRGWAVSLAAVLPTVAAAAPGDVLEVDLVRGAASGWRYEILVLTRQGRYREVIVDARRNVVIEVRER